MADSAGSSAELFAGQDRAVAAANKAIALAPELPDGYRARGFVRVPIQWDWAGSRADFERALALRPDDPETLSDYAYVVLRSQGHIPEAIAFLHKAAEFDPLNARIWDGIGAVLAIHGERGPAREAFNRSLEISPVQSYTPYHLAVTFLEEGKPAEALAISQRSAHEIFRLAGAAEAEHDLGHEKESLQAIDQAIKRWGDIGAAQIAEVYAWRGDKDRAFEWLERAFRQRDGGLATVKIDPLLRSLHGDPRFAVLLKKMNLPPD